MKAKLKHSIKKVIIKNEDIIVTILDFTFKVLGYSIVTITALTMLFIYITAIILLKTYPIA